MEMTVPPQDPNIPISTVWFARCWFQFVSSGLVGPIWGWGGFSIWGTLQSSNGLSHHLLLIQFRLLELFDLSAAFVHTKCVELAAWTPYPTHYYHCLPAIFIPVLSRGFTSGVWGSSTIPSSCLASLFDLLSFLLRLALLLNIVYPVYVFHAGWSLLQEETDEESDDESDDDEGPALCQSSSNIGIARARLKNEGPSNHTHWWLSLSHQNQGSLC